jgi:predicted ribosomally synthesized peptide with SipW-like signal peptide
MTIARLRRASELDPKQAMPYNNLGAALRNKGRGGGEPGTVVGVTAMTEQTLFHEALAKPVAERAAFLDGVCSGQPKLRAAVESLLALHEVAGSFLTQPAFADILQTTDTPGTSDHHRGSDTTDGSHPRSDVAAGDLPAVPGYRVLRELARGGMGRVLAAYDLRLERDVALKVLLPGANADRFVRESKITARLPHPGIPPVHALGTLADGSPYLAMKLIAGQTLAEEMKSADRPRLLQVFTQVCQAVGFAHSREIIHRDLKPGNVMVGAFGEVQVMDWGLAKELGERRGLSPPSEPDRRDEPGGSPEQTQAGTILGTPAYMAPEQARGEATDARSDVFALGGILCAILTGQSPFCGKSLPEIIRRAGAADLAETNARLDGCGADAELIALCRRCLSPRPVDRPADGQAVADALIAYLNGVQERLQTAERERAVALTRETEQRKRRRVQLALAAAVLVLLAGGGTFAWWQDRQASERNATEARLAGERDAQERNKREQARQSIDANLKLATDLRKQYRFKQAKAALDQALLLATGAAPDRLAEVEQAHHDLELVARLDDIRFRKWMWIAVKSGKGKFNHQIAAPEYRQAFAKRDLDLTTLDPAEAAKRIAASALKAELVAAVDDWALYEPEPSLRDRLLDVARRADPGPWTNRLRNSAVLIDRDAVEKLAKDADPASTSAATLSMLARRMEHLNLNPAPLLRAARTAHPTDFELAFALARWHGNRVDDQATGSYEAARALRPENVAVWLNLGQALGLKGQVEEAIVCCRKAIELNPKLALAHINLGFALLSDKGRAEESTACFRKGIELNPTFAEAHYGLGLALEKKSQVEEAIACFKKALELDPKLAAAHSNLGAILFDVKRDYNGAIACFEKAIELDPKLARARFNLGNALKDKGQMDEAIACYRKALELDPKLIVAHCNLGDVLSRTDRMDEAIVCWRNAIAVDPKFTQVHFNLGLALYGLGKFDEAVSFFRKAVALDPQGPKAHGALGQALIGQGRYAEARNASARALALLPENHPMRTPASRQVRICEQLLKLEERLLRLLRGEDRARSVLESLDLARMCQLKRLNAAAARFSAEAFAGAPKLADNLQARHRYHAACSAVLAATGKGPDAAKLDEAAKARWRGQALDWLKTDLTALGKLLESGPPRVRPFVVRTLNNWQNDSDLAGIRDAAALSNLPVDELKAFTQLWADVAALLEKAEGKRK